MLAMIYGLHSKWLRVLLCCASVVATVLSQEMEPAEEYKQLERDYEELRAMAGNIDAAQNFRRRGVGMIRALQEELAAVTMQNQYLRSQFTNSKTNTNNQQNLHLAVPDWSLKRCSVKGTGSQEELQNVAARDLAKVIALRAKRPNGTLTFTTSNYKGMHLLAHWSLQLSYLGLNNFFVAATDAGAEATIERLQLPGACFAPRAVSEAEVLFTVIVDALEAGHSVVHLSLDVFPFQNILNALATDASSLVSVVSVEGVSAHPDPRAAATSMSAVKNDNDNDDKNDNVNAQHDVEPDVATILEILGVDIATSTELSAKRPTTSILLIRPSAGGLALARGCLARVRDVPSLSASSALQLELKETPAVAATLDPNVFATADRFGHTSMDASSMVTLSMEEVEEHLQRQSKLFRLYTASHGPAGFVYPFKPLPTPRVLIDLGMPVYVISIARNPLRRERMKLHLEEMGIKASFYSGIDGYGLTSEEFDFVYDKEEHLRNNPPHTDRVDGLNRGNIGTCLSHYRLWQTLLDSRVNQALIIEDDAQFHSDIARLPDAMSMLPNDWGLVHLTHREFDNTPNFHPYDVVASKDGMQLVTYPGLVYYLLGYVITANTMESVLSRVYPIYEVVDVFVNPRFYPFPTRAGHSWEGIKRYGLMPRPNQRFVDRDEATATTVFGESG